MFDKIAKAGETDIAALERTLELLFVKHTTYKHMLEIRN